MEKYLKGTYKLRLQMFMSQVFSENMENSSMKMDKNKLYKNTLFENNQAILATTENDLQKVYM
jgi:4-diphosphocytidyl-2C-methyl-D-erythritol kinase